MTISGNIISGTDPIANDTIGGRMSLAREAVGYDIAEAARRLGVTQRTWRDWEADRAEPRSSRLVTMAGILAVSPSWLIMGAGSGPVDREELKAERATVELRRARRDLALAIERIDAALDAAG